MDSKPVSDLDQGARSILPETRILEIALDQSYKLLDQIAAQGLTPELLIAARRLLPPRFQMSFSRPKGSAIRAAKEQG